MEIYEKKSLFLQSIPSALEHMRWFTQNVRLNVELPQLWKVLESLKDVDPNIAKI